MNADFKIEGNSVIIYGPTDFSGAEVAATDLRAAAALVLAGLLSRGITQVTLRVDLSSIHFKIHTANYSILIAPEKPCFPNQIRLILKYFIKKDC